MVVEGKETSAVNTVVFGPRGRCVWAMCQVDVPMICMDVANGYSEHFVNAVRKMREGHPSHTILAGNVVSRHTLFVWLCLSSSSLTATADPSPDCVHGWDAGLMAGR